jgi:hypothetical protein
MKYQVAGKIKALQYLSTTSSYFQTLTCIRNRKQKEKIMGVESTKEVN